MRCFRHDVFDAFLATGLAAVTQSRQAVVETISNPAASVGIEPALQLDFDEKSEESLVGCALCTPQHDVFLSHAGEEKREFVGWLYKALVQRGLRVFVDYESLPRDYAAQRSDVAMATAARTTPIGLFLVSRAFVSKKWPVREARIFLERHARGDSSVRILPVFYWGDAFKPGAFDEIAVENRQTAMEIFERLSNWSGVVRYESDFSYDLVPKVADMVAGVASKLDVEVALRQLPAGEALQNIDTLTGGVCASLRRTHTSSSTHIHAPPLFFPCRSVVRCFVRRATSHRGDPCPSCGEGRCISEAANNRLVGARAPLFAWNMRCPDSTSPGHWGSRDHCVWFIEHRSSVCAGVARVCWQ